jgi:hypothetical protein
LPRPTKVAGVTRRICWLNFWMTLPPAVSVSRWSSSSCIQAEPSGCSRAARPRPGGLFLRGDAGGKSAASRFQGVKTDSTTKKTLHRCLKFGCRGDPHLVGQFNDRFTLTGNKEMQRDYARSLMFKKSLAQLY